MPKRFIRVRGRAGRVIERNTDSGGPWYKGNTAYGIHSGGNKQRTAIYMPINYIRAQDLRVVTAS